MKKAVFLFISTLLVSCCFLFFEINILVQNGTRLVNNSSYRIDAQEILKYYYKVICDESRFSICSVHFYENVNTLTFSVPYNVDKDSIQNSIHITKNISMSIFADKAFVRVIIFPNLLHLISIYFLACLFHIPVIIFYLYLMKNIELNKSKDLNRISRQVAHDVKSPLAMLNVAIDENSLSNFEKNIYIKMAISRINEISNQLVKSENVKLKYNIEFKNLNELIKLIILEKKMQVKEGLSFVLENQSSPEQYEVLVDEVEFSRVISNLLNNSIDAKASVITIKFLERNNNLKLIIKDNGQGISIEVLKKLNNFVFETTKEYGNGLGLSHAFTTMKNFEAMLEINSAGEWKGTEVVATFTKYLRKSGLDDENILLDDDNLVHLSWKTYARIHNKKLLCFKKSDEMLEYLSKKNERKLNVFLDYDLNEKLNGYDVAVKLREMGFNSLFLISGAELQSKEEGKVFSKIISKAPVF